MQAANGSAAPDTAREEQALMDRIVRFITAADYARIPEEMRVLAKHAVIDTVGVAVCGWREPAVQIVKEVFAQPDAGSQQSSLWGEKSRLESHQAAAVNGTASHVLDFDDATVGIPCHPSAPVLAAAIPLAEKLGSSGEELITAYAVGTEVLIQIGMAMGYHHYQLGWHATDTLGTIGAAAACARLLHLNEEQCANAIAIAASMAGGLVKNFGTMTKSLHVGLAASHGIQAAELAGRGFTGNRDIFETRGFFHAFNAGGDERQLRENLRRIRFGDPYDFLANGRLSVKKFPCCYGAHRFIQGALDLRREHGLTLENIKEIKLIAPPGGLLPLVHHRPQSGLEAKFCAEYLVLAAIADGYVKLGSFTDAMVRRPEIQRMLPQVQAVETEGEAAGIQEQPDIVQIVTRSGQTLEITVRHPPGSAARPLSEQEYLEKWTDCLKNFAAGSPDGGAADVERAAEELYEKGMKLESYARFGDWLNEMKERLM